MMTMQTEQQPLSCCPSFSTATTTTTYDHSSETLSQIATRVIHEFRFSDPDSLLCSSQQNDDVPDDDDDFEFSFLPRDSASSPVSADDIFHNGHITPTVTFPLFDTSLLNSPPPRRSPLRTLMFEEDGVADGTYCVWTPPSKKKSSSDGSSSSKRWKLRDLLVRSHSDGGKRSNKVAPKHAAAKEVEQSKKKASLFSNGNRIGQVSQN